MSRRVLAEGKFLRLVDEDTWEFVERTNASGIVLIAAQTDADELVLVEQFRPPVKAQVIELPAGLVGDIPGDEDEALVSAAFRELEEEAGYRAQRMELLMVAPDSAAKSSSMIHIFRAHGLTRVGEGGGDETETIAVHVVPMDGLLAWLGAQRASGKLIDTRVYSVLPFLS